MLIIGIIAWCLFWGTLFYIADNPMPMLKFIALMVGIVITSFIILCGVMLSIDVIFSIY